MEEREVLNAVIGKTRLGPEASDYRGFAISVEFKLPFGNQGLGGYVLDQPVERNGRKDRQGTAWGMEFLRRLMATLEIGSWDDLEGSTVRVVRENGLINGIGHFLKDQWFFPQTDLEYLKDTNGYCI